MSNDGSELLEISNALVALQKELFGRGPTKARTYMFEDLVACVLEGGMTRAEEVLHAHGRADLVEGSRLEMQHVAEAEMIAAVERVTGRKVRGFTSGTDPNRDIQVETFILEPEAASPEA
jgi:uncharacterized protein YbcI